MINNFTKQEAGFLICMIRNDLTRVRAQRLKGMLKESVLKFLLDKEIFLTGILKKLDTNSKLFDNASDNENS